MQVFSARIRGLATQCRIHAIAAKENGGNVMTAISRNLRQAQRGG